MGTLFETGTLLHKARTVNVKTDLPLVEYADSIVALMPEMKKVRMKHIKRKNVVRAMDDPTVKINGTKLKLTKLEFAEILPGTIAVSIEYSTPAFRPFLFLACLLGFLAGLIPGLVIWFIFREPADEEVKKVMPALSRFEAVLES